MGWDTIFIKFCFFFKKSQDNKFLKNVGLNLSVNSNKRSPTECMGLVTSMLRIKR